jgi:hypothetical protein
VLPSLVVPGRRVLVPGSCGVGEVFVGGGVAVAEGLGDDGGGGLEDEFAEGGGAGLGGLLLRVGGTRFELVASSVSAGDDLVFRRWSA